ncbi:transcriptional regulatory protein CutR [Nocardioides baekrokdamisoli]|uniref:Transcriptional regulatory protein CutR n=1 Tax=Nocardioides baekrokdamisoli TaxID=1804624 RepID=A0A3G9IZW5_9ACTN|nr:response regulator transcription factor [Nocardioides baekrokdamisoli]BBH16918.1 transcriptional regulatory protein CutR [Nocardioides baekrokdamisoli]
MGKILVVEDEAVMANAVASGLRRHGFVVDCAEDGHVALSKAELVPYDVVLLDRDLPVIHGDEVCRRLRELGCPSRILMLTAARSVPDRVDGLRMGADDYLTKPYAFAELLARVEALMRRPEQPLEQIVEVAGLVIDRARRRVERGGVAIDLSVKEFGVLEVLAAQPGAVISAETLLDRVWDEMADPFTNAVRVTMVGLRRKLGEPSLITTMRGVGYRLDPAGAAVET